MSGPDFPARLSFVKDLPHEQTGTGAGGADPASLDRAIATGSHVRLLGRTGCENHDSSTPYSSDVSFRVRFGGPNRPKIPNQIHFKISVWGTHDSATRHLPRLA